MGSVVDGRRALQAVVWGKPTVSMPRKAAVLGARGRGCRTPPGSRGHVGEPEVSGAQDRPGGAGAQRPWRERGLRPVHAPVRETTNHRSRQGTRDARDQRRVPRGARWPSERSLRPTQVGPCGPNAPWEGRRRRDARGAGRTDGRAVELTNRHTTPPAPGRASPTGARSGDHDAGPPIDEDWRCEAYRQPRHASAPGIDGVTAPASGAPRDETRRDRSARLRRLKQAWWWGCRTHRHAPMTDHDQRRGLTLRGHVRDDGSRGHVRRREEGLDVAEKAWCYWLRRRSRQRAIGWETFPPRLMTSVLPTPTIIHTR